MANRDQEFRRIRENLGSVFGDGGPDEYFARLVQLTDNPDEFLDWDAAHPVTTPPTTDPAALLSLMRNVSFRDNRAVGTLADSLSAVTGGVIPLTQDERRRLLVAPDETALMPGASDEPLEEPEDGGDEPVTPDGPPAHPLIFALEEVGSSRSGSSSQAIPRHVVLLGRLLIHDIRKIEDIPEDERYGMDVNVENRPRQSTNYAVVVDATSADKSVWLIYNRRPYDEEEGITEAEPAEDDLLLFPPERNFHSARLLQSLSSWDISQRRPAMNNLQTAIESTKGNVAIIAKPAPAEEVARVLGA
ncbi:hypothetical protein F4802DRAFT_601417 [Xylaria palmicola]|nr:hypothetical protein F4802DRAFT_601417 [Xylaria palmicola]